MAKKLEGNGRWESSRIMLPEHREQYLARYQRGKNPINDLTHEEMIFMKDSVILPMVREIVQRNRSEIEKKTRSLRPLFVKATDMLIALVDRDLHVAKKNLRIANIYVREVSAIDGIATYRYNCRGYEDSFAMTREYVRIDINGRIGRYISEIFNNNH